MISSKVFSIIELSGIAVIADRDTVTLFKLVGVKRSFAVDSIEEAEKVLTNLIEEDLSVIIITKRLAQHIQQTIAKLTIGRKYPIILVIPGKGEPIEKEVISIRDYLRRALGIEFKTG